MRLQSKTTDNVVNYTVVVAVPNEAKKLLPGMTARVEFLTKSAENVMKVANAALRYKPATTTTTTKAPARRQSSTLYFVDNAGKVQMTRVRTGITDGTTTEVQGKDLTEGMKVIAGTTSSTQTAATSTASGPFPSNSSSSQRGQRAPGGF